MHLSLQKYLQLRLSIKKLRYSDIPHQEKLPSKRLNSKNGGARNLFNVRYNGQKIRKSYRKYYFGLLLPMKPSLLKNEMSSQEKKVLPIQNLYQPIMELFYKILGKYNLKWLRHEDSNLGPND